MHVEPGNREVRTRAAVHRIQDAGTAFLVGNGVRNFDLLTQPLARPADGSKFEALPFRLALIRHSLALRPVRNFVHRLQQQPGGRVSPFGLDGYPAA